LSEDAINWRDSTIETLQGVLGGDALCGDRIRRSFYGARTINPNELSSAIATLDFE
jgi:hypothetical protein